MSTNIEIEILDDGTVSVKTGNISDVHHVQADNLLDEIAEMLGGKRATEKVEPAESKAFWAKRRVLKGGKIQRIK